MKSFINIKNYKKIILTLAIFSFLIYAIFQALYPTMTCQGTYSNLNKWTSDYDLKDTKIIEDSKVNLAWSFQVRRDAIYINDERFPLFKELNYKNVHAWKTQTGFSGRRLGNFIQHRDYSFEYNNITKQLSVVVLADGPHILEKEVGKDKLKANFVGICERKWF
jgi:hypothetical protein